MPDGGKGSSPRPFSVDQQTFADNWDKIFKKPSPQEVQDAKNEDDAFKHLESLQRLQIKNGKE